MRNYEAMYIIKSTLDDEALTALVTRFEDVVKNGGGDLIKSDRLGKRRLAYTINDNTEGYYILMTFQAPSIAAQELARLLKIHDDVIRHLVIKKDQ